MKLYSEVYYIGKGNIIGPLTVWSVDISHSLNGPFKTIIKASNFKEGYSGEEKDFVTEKELIGKDVYVLGKVAAKIIRLLENDKVEVYHIHYHGETPFYGGSWIHELNQLSLKPDEKFLLTKEPDQGKIEEMKTAYTPPSNYKETLELILKYFPTFKIQSADQVYKIKEILNTLKVKFTIDSFRKDYYGEIFESELISTILDWPEISNDDVNSAMMLAEECVRSIQIRDMLNPLDAQFEKYLTDANKQGSQIAIAEQQKAKSVELEKCKANIKALSISLKQSKAKSKVVKVEEKPITIESTSIKNFTDTLFGLANKTDNTFSDVAVAAEGFSQQGLTTEKVLKATEFVLSIARSLNQIESISKNAGASFKQLSKLIEDIVSGEKLRKTAAQPNKKILVLEHKRFLLNSALTLAPGTKIDILRADDSRVNDKNYDLIIS